MRRRVRTAAVMSLRRRKRHDAGEECYISAHEYLYLDACIIILLHSYRAFMHYIVNRKHFRS